MGVSDYYSYYQLPSNKVFALEKRLRGGGFGATINHYLIILVELLLRWILWRTERADFVHIVCTETNLLRVNGKEATGKGHAALWVRNILYNLQFGGGSIDTKVVSFVPIAQYS